MNDATIAKEKRDDLTNDTFDPLKDLILAQGTEQAAWVGINLRTLSPFQRALLVIDGTVTKFIESYMMEPVDVVRLTQELQRLPEDHAWLEAPMGTEVITRQVLLRGRNSLTVYAYAASLLIPDRLPEAVKQKLEVDIGGIGRILLNSRMESFREVLWFGRERVNALPVNIRNFFGDGLISRTYRIFYNGRPTILINEKFPSENDWVPDHH